MTVIEFRNVSKTFSQVHGRMLLRRHIERRLRKPKKEIFYALKDVSFRLAQGESLAVVGRNGAGKSTLLSVVAGLALPNEGAVTVNGRVAALLELGSGFHPDLTGAENIRLNASLLGLGRRASVEAFDQVVEFSGLADFIDQPLRTYSTGMAMRLAFSVAVMVEPDVLIIDEVLTVGDAAFQAKCLDKIMDFRAAGKTILCVSHSAGMVQQLCSRALWLDHGEVMMDGAVQDVVEAYGGLKLASGA